MLKTYFKIAWRNLVKHKAFALMNITGLSAGIAFVLLIGAYIWGELQVNKILHHNDRTYIVRSNWKVKDMGLDLTTPAPIGKALKENFPDLVEEYYHHDGIGSVVSKNDRHFREGLQPGDSTFLTVFGFPLLYGDAKTALNDPYSVVITENRALKYFGRKDVMGETLTIQSFSGSKQEFKVTAVLKDLPYNTITNFYQAKNEIFLSGSSLPFFGREQLFRDWNNNFMVNYVRLKKGVSPADLEKPVRQLLSLHTTATVQQNLDIYFTPLDKYYLQVNNGLPRRMILTLALVAFFILLMAVINYVNIFIGNSVSRLREIGVRKVMGSSRKQLIGQFLSESLVIVSIAVIFAMMLYPLLRPAFSNILGKPLPLLSAFPLYFLMVPVIIALLISLLAGLYPAFVLSLQPSIESLKGKLKTVKEKVVFRRSLITVQFVTAIVVFTGAIVIDKQISFSFNKNLGYDKEQIITADLPRDWSVKGVRHMETVRDQFITMPEVEDASFAYEIMDGASGGGGQLYKAAQDSSKAVLATGLQTDEHFADTYKLRMAAGKYLTSPGGNYDSSAIVINETAASALGWKNTHEAVGQLVKMQGQPLVMTITGVVKDFHFGSMHEAIRPVFISHVRLTTFYRHMSFRVRPGNAAATIAALEKKWNVLLPGSPFPYRFMDESLSRLYETELQMKKAAETATLLALVIMVLGVLGIVSLSIARRIKEVGIRKVLGASVLQIILLFMKEFGWVVLIANLIAWPVAWFLLNGWLHNFVYRVRVNIAPFLVVAIAVSLLVALVIALQTIRKAMENPVKNLRTE
jgi:putative ABC transport system permease protein